MRKFATAVMIGATLLVGAIAPGQASVVRPDGIIRVEGKVYEGVWTMIGDRPYIGVESFARAVGLPRNHNAKYWYLAKEGTGKGSPYQLQVESGTVKIPTVRFGGATMIDLEAACTALKIPFHRDKSGRFWEVGSYRDAYMVGSHYRNWANHDAWYAGSHHEGGHDVWSDGDWWGDRSGPFFPDDDATNPNTR